jgi:hypothetical protein
MSESTNQSQCLTLSQQKSFFIPFDRILFELFDGMNTKFDLQNISDVVQILRMFNT